MTSAANQSRYQVRFDWGIAGANVIAPGTHIVIWVDALPEPFVDPLQLKYAGAIVTGSTGSRAAVADWVLARQVQRGDRVSVAVVAAGGPHDRFAVEDLVVAGAVIEALAELGLDYASPEAAAACAAFAGLRRAGSHVLTASVNGQELLEREGIVALDAASEASEAAGFSILREFTALA